MHLAQNKPTTLSLALASGIFLVSISLVSICCSTPRRGWAVVCSSHNVKGAAGIKRSALSYAWPQPLKGGAGICSHPSSHDMPRSGLRLRGGSEQGPSQSGMEANATVSAQTHGPETADWLRDDEFRAMADRASRLNRGRGDKTRFLPDAKQQDREWADDSDFMWTREEVDISHCISLVLGFTLSCPLAQCRQSLYSHFFLGCI
jgi:hypothetical protein